MKKTIGIIATIGIICIAIATVQASITKKTVIEYGKYLVSTELVGGPWVHTILEPTSKNLASVNVTNYIYRIKKGKWEEVRKETLAVRNTTLRYPKNYFLETIENTRTTWVVSTQGGKVEGEFTFSDGQI